MATLAALLQKRSRACIRPAALAAVTTVAALAVGALPASSETSAGVVDGELISSKTYLAPTVRAYAKLLIYHMPGVKGKMIRASSLLFAPQGTRPTSGSLIMAWAHGTATPGQKKFAPSLTPMDLDGGLTAGGFKSNFAYEVHSLISAGYAGSPFKC